MTEVIRNMRLDGNPFKDDSPTEVKLKTLQEIEDCNFEAGCSYGMAFEVIKKEAIKWCKMLRARSISDDIPLSLTLGSGSPETMIDWIRHFFNLTEDDLK